MYYFVHFFHHFEFYFQFTQLTVKVRIHQHFFQLICKPPNNVTHNHFEVVFVFELVFIFLVVFIFEVVFIFYGCLNFWGCLSFWVALSFKPSSFFNLSSFLWTSLIFPAPAGPRLSLFPFYPPTHSTHRDSSLNHAMTAATAIANCKHRRVLFSVLAL